ncbi:MAG: helix-turn-helix transcriptional regulator [Candidatus Magasanikbacteria bacterium]
MHKKQSPIDPIAEAKKDKNFSIYSKDARVKVRLAVNVYEKRKQKGWSQIDLAKEIHTTQKVISNIESGDVNIGIVLLKRLVDGLNFSNDDLENIFESCRLLSLNNNTANTEEVVYTNFKKEYTYETNQY